MPHKIRTPKGKKITINNYITEGSYGIIYSANGENDENLAVKIVPVGKNGVSHIECKNEGRNIKKCKNIPFVMEYIEVFIVDEKLFVIMPKYKQLPESPSIKQIAKWFFQLLVGLNGIHQRGIIHGDIKNTNLMITDDDELRIIDLGISVKNGSQDRDICPHILKSKKRLLDSIEAYNQAAKKAKNENNIIVDLYPTACPYDDLVAAAYTILSLFEGGKIIKTRVNDIYFPKDSFESILKEIENINFEEKISEIIKNNCKEDTLYYNYFYEFLSEILCFKDNEPSIPNILKRMFDNYFEIITNEEQTIVAENYKKRCKTFLKSNITLILANYIPPNVIPSSLPEFLQGKLKDTTLFTGASTKCPTHPFCIYA